MADGHFQVRSFRVVFALERRIHKIDRWRIPVPQGVPLRGLAYAIGALLLVVLLAGVPVVGELLGLLAAPLRLVILPVALAYLLTQLRVDGRPAHAVALAWLRHMATPRRLSGFRAANRTGHRASLGELVLVPDERSARYRRAVIMGPARVLLRVPARAHARARTLRLRQVPGAPMVRGHVVQLQAGQQLEVEG